MGALTIRARALIKFLTTPKKHPGAGVTTTKKLRGKPNFRWPASPPRWRRRGTTSCWAAARRCAARLGCTPRARRRGSCRSTQDCRRCGTWPLVAVVLIGSGCRSAPSAHIRDLSFPSFCRNSRNHPGNGVFSRNPAPCRRGTNPAPAGRFGPKNILET